MFFINLILAHKVNNIQSIKDMSSYSPRDGLYTHWPQNVYGFLHTEFAGYDSFEERFLIWTKWWTKFLIKMVSNCWDNKQTIQAIWNHFYADFLFSFGLN